ncbi:predicted protein [Lichtheimia corymbifera JMRC:FSU:9682]|uniref:Uncharacterized protein n=1 Tax=Lichtheimia corymbifera JMRC:FSU:9682 TaxID=1263082 RepID=A0A068S3M7_9FUNG|nr:predicted protein [Lichtheimia corymbifera JMRC:FSU:9682]
MDAIKCSDEISWNVALVTWRVFRRNHHVDTVEDDDGLDGLYLVERCFTAMDVIGTLKSMHAAAILQSWMKDIYDGSNQEYNGTVIPVD